MARPRTPTNVLQLRGAGKKHPERMREREGEMEAFGQIGGPPDHLTESEAGCWVELMGNLPGGALSQSDRTQLELVSRLLAYARVTPIQDIPSHTLARLMSGLGQMGMTPADRSKVKLGAAPQTNPFLED